MSDQPQPETILSPTIPAKRPVTEPVASTRSDVTVAPASEAAPASLPLSGRLQIRRELGRGGMGVVWEAFDPSLRRTLAVKVLLQADPDDERRFLEEAQITGQLQHPAIPPVHEIGRLDDDRPFLAMKLIEGRTLAELLSERAKAAHDLPRYLAIFTQVCQAVGYAHARGVIHRDLKPANIMVGAFGEVQVMDWGLAKVLSAGNLNPATATPIRTTRTDQDVNRSQFGQVMGTPSYMAPEQARGEVGELDERSDVFGLGAILCEILCGRPPFLGSTASEVVGRSARGELADCYIALEGSGADGELRRLARRCLAAQAKDRPRCGGEVADELEAYLTGVQERLRSAEVERARAEVKSVEERKRRWMTLGLAAALLLLVVGGGLAAWWSERRQSEQNAERARQQERTRLQAETAIRQARALYERALWHQANALLKEAHLGLGEHEPLRQQVTDVRQEVELLQRLDRIRQDKGILVEGKLNERWAREQFTATFRAAGFDVLQADVDSLAQELKSHPASEHLLSALDDWATLRCPVPERARLWQLTAAITGEPWRRSVVDEEGNLTRTRLAQVLAEENRLRMSPQVQLDLAEWLEAKGGEGLPIMVAAWQRRPGDFLLSLSLGNVMLTPKHGRWDDAISYFRAALALRSDSVALWNNLGRALHQKKENEAALAALRKGLEIDARAAVLWINLGAILVEDKNGVESACAAYRKAVEYAPTEAAAWSSLGNALRVANDLDGALAACNKALELEPRRATAWYNLGLALRARKDFKGAQNAHRQAVEIDPNFARAWFHLGNALLDTKNVEEAVAAYRKAVEADAHYVPAWGHLGSALWLLGKRPEAIAAFRKAATLDPRDAKARYNLGVVYLEQKNLEAAIAEFRQAVALDPRNGQNRNTLGHVLRQHGDLRGSAEAFREVITLAPRQVLGYVNLAEVLEQDRQFDDAVTTCERALALDADNLTAHKVLGSAQLRLGRFAEARTTFAKFLELAPEQHSQRTRVRGQQLECERFLEADKHLAAIDKGEAQPSEAEKLLVLGRLCRDYRKRPLASVRFYSAAFTVDPKAADNLGRGYRYNAAKSAVRAALGEGDAAGIDEKERLRLRRQALDWLRASLAGWQKQANGKPLEKQARDALLNWQKSEDLVSVRESEGLAKLPADEAAAWKSFWGEVAGLLAPKP